MSVNNEVSLELSVYFYLVICLAYVKFGKVLPSNKICKSIFDFELRIFLCRVHCDIEVSTDAKSPILFMYWYDRRSPLHSIQL